MVTPAPATKRWGWWLAVGVAAVLVIAGGVTAAVLLRGPDQVAIPQVVVTLEPVGNAGPDPFVGVKGVSPVKAISDPVRSAAAATAASMSRDETTGTLSTAGTTNNLYGGAQSTELFGGSGNLGECDVPKLAEFLAANPDKARAWAEVRGIAPERISAYLQTLTPVVLLQDTLVTNYGFSGGVATPRQSVLQAGTAVLVDATGQPVVRCACGNPLTAPATINLPSATVQGTPWVGYDPARAVLVKSAPAATELVLVDVSTGESYPQPVGAAEPDDDDDDARRRRHHRRRHRRRPRKARRLRRTAPSRGLGPNPDRVGWTRQTVGSPVRR